MLNNKIKIKENKNTKSERQLNEEKSVTWSQRHDERFALRDNDQEPCRIFGPVQNIH